MVLGNEIFTGPKLLVLQNIEGGELGRVNTLET